MATRRPIRPTNEQGRLITQEEKDAAEWRRKHENAPLDTTVLVMLMIVAYPFVMIGRGLRRLGVYCDGSLPSV